MLTDDTFLAVAYFHINNVNVEASKYIYDHNKDIPLKVSRERQRDQYSLCLHLCKQEGLASISVLFVAESLASFSSQYRFIVNTTVL